MDDDDDFTFCKVDQEVDDDHLESPKRIPDIKNITLQDNSLNVAITIQDDAPRRIAGTEATRPSDSSSKDIDTTAKSNFELKGTDTLKPVAEGKGSATQAAEQKPITKKSAVRAKVPFEKGYSQMDWLKLTRTHPDLAELKGRSNRRLISMDEVKQHKSDGSVWTVLKGHVYNISPYMKFHPGGVDMLMKAAGKDCTSLFNKYHAWVNAEFLLEKCLVGVLDSK